MSCSIFVGNVPYDASEDQLRDIFSRVGTVTSIRLVCDKDTNQPKGYAFVDYSDSNAVDAAVRQLSNVEYNGRRLRVDWAERELHHTSELSGGRPAAGGPRRGGTDQLPALPPPPVVAPTVADHLADLREREAAERSAVDAADKEVCTEIMRLLETLTPCQILHIMAEMQLLSLRAPEVARALVTENLQLCLALQYGQYLVGMVDQPTLPCARRIQDRVRQVKEILNGSGQNEEPKPMDWRPEPQQLAPGNYGGVAPGGVPGMPGGAGHFIVEAPAAAAPMPAALPPLPPALPPSAADPTHAPGPMPMAGRPGMPPAANGGGRPTQGVEITGTPEERQQLLQRLVQLSPDQIDQLPHDTKVQLLEFLQQQSAG